LHPVTATAGLIFRAVPIRDWYPGPTDLGMAGRPPDSIALEHSMPSDGPATPLPGPHQRAGREETESGGPPATLEGEGDGGTSLSDPTLDAGPAPPPPGLNQGPGRAAEAADPPDGVVDFPSPPPQVRFPQTSSPTSNSFNSKSSNCTMGACACACAPMVGPLCAAALPLPGPAGGPGQVAEAPGVAPSPPGPDQGPGRAAETADPPSSCAGACAWP